MEDIVKIVKCLEESALYLKGVSEKIRIKLKNKTEGFSECYDGF